MIGETFRDIQCIVNENGKNRYLSFDEIIKLSTPKNFYNIILFYFPNDDEYYNKAYIKECLFSWKKVFPNSRFINIPIFEAQGLSKWSMLTYRRRNFPTDSLRILFAAHLKNCIYLDTDVYLTHRFEMPKRKDCFVLNDCSGTMLFNKKKNNKKLLKWFEKYEETADYILKNSNDRATQDHLIDEHGDLSMYNKFGKSLKIPSLDFRHGINHFSTVYPYMRDKKNLGIAINPRGSVVSFEAEAIYAFSLYCYDRKYTDYISQCFYDPYTFQNIGFYTS